MNWRAYQIFCDDGEETSTPYPLKYCMVKWLMVLLRYPALILYSSFLSFKGIYYNIPIFMYKYTVSIAVLFIQKKIMFTNHRLFFKKV